MPHVEDNTILNCKRKSYDKRSHGLWVFIRAAEIRRYVGAIWMYIDETTYLEINLYNKKSRLNRVTLTFWRLKSLKLFSIYFFSIFPKKIVKVKLKCTLVQALRLCTGRTAHMGSRGIALLFYDHGTRREWGVKVTPRPLSIPRERPGTHCTGGWLGTRVGLDRCGKSRPHWDSIPGPSSP
jgi:hypothetical protein